MSKAIGCKSSFFQTLKLILVTFGIIGFAATPAFAHARTYVWNQEYKTLPKGVFEVESHTRVQVPDMGKESSENKWKFSEELEYGLTDRLSIGHYQIWERENQDGLDSNGVPNKDFTKYAGFKFETKYRIGEKGKYWVDPLLYVEYEYEYESQDRKDGAPHVFENKIVLSKDYENLNFTYNQIMENKLGHKGRTEHAFSVGLNYEFFEGFRAGVETKGQYWNPEGHHNEIALGPTVAYEWKYFWVAAGILIGANHAADDFQGQISVGIPIG